MQFILNGFGIRTRYIHSPSKSRYPLVFLKLLLHFMQRRPEIVHAHLFEAGFLSMPAALLAGIPQRIFTRHHATYHAEYFPHMVKYDRLINFLSTSIVSISSNVTEVLIENEHVNPRKIHTIPHGFDFKPFQNVPITRVAGLQKQYGIGTDHHPVVGVISRFVELKGIQYIIPAFIELRKEHPEAHLILANAVGNYTSEIHSLLKDVPANYYTIIQFEKDLFALYKLFDIFVHVPINPQVEAYGQVYIEALAAGIPSIFTLSGIAREFIENERNALVVPFKDSMSILHSMQRLINNQALRKRLITEGRFDVTNSFSLETMLHKLQTLYG